MKRLFLFFTLLFLPVFAEAQDVTDYPICTQLINESAYTVRGSIATATATYSDPSDSVKDGTTARHAANFKLKPEEKMDVCSQGPFFAGRRVELTLRTLIPVFECQTTLENPIIIKSERDENGDLKTWAECY